MLIYSDLFVSSSSHTKNSAVMVMIAEGAKKFGVMGKLGCQEGKKGRLMDGVVMKHCSAVLKKLMMHEAGWIFNQPVDPVKLKIPDYFSIITEPMDLGTVRSRLESGVYLDTKEFAADVRLTFSNAMRYNPPYNDVHLIAKELNDLFNSRWKSLETMWRGEGSMTLEQTVPKKTQKQTLKSGQTCHRTSSHCSSLSPRRSMSFTEKQILRKDLAELLDRNAPPPLLKILRKFGTVGANRDRVDIDFEALDYKVLWELNKIVKSCPKSTSTKPTVVDNKRGCRSGRELLKGKVQNNSLTSTKSKSYTSAKAASVSIKGSYDGMDHCSEFNQVSSSGRKDHACNDDASNLDRLACNDTTASSQGNSNPDFDVVVDLWAEENVQLCSSPAIGGATITEGSIDLCYDEQLSPSKAIRAAMLRSRFADTILKAQQNTLLNNGGTVDAVKMQQERERLQKREQEVKVKMEQKIRAAKAAARDMAEAKLKMQREREREAARIALQKMEKTVEIDDNKEILKDLEMLVYNQPTHDQNMLTMAINGCHGNLLEQLGLFMKNDDIEDDADSVSGST